MTLDATARQENVKASLEIYLYAALVTQEGLAVRWEGAGLDTIAAQGIPGISAEAADLRRNMSYDGATIRYYALGAAYNDGRWLLQGELGLADTSADMVSNGAMAYLSLGRHLGDWTPYAVLSRVESHHAPRGARTDWGTIGQAAFQELALGAHNSTRFEQTGLSLGLRWDPLPQSAVKLQWDRYFVGSDGYGLWWTSESRDEQREIDVFTLSTEFIF